MQFKRQQRNSHKSRTTNARKNTQKNWIFESIKSLYTVAETAGDIISMFRKPIQKVGEKVFEEIFDAKGKSKGFNFSFQ